MHVLSLPHIAAMKQSNCYSNFLCLLVRLLHWCTCRNGLYTSQSFYCLVAPSLCSFPAKDWYIILLDMDANL